MGILVFISVLLVAACGLIYELVAGTLASYLVGDSVFQFSTIIGTYLFAMGIGSALSRYINRGLANRFVWIELVLGVVGGFSSALLMLAFAFTQGFELILYALVIVMGVLVGLEIPLLMRIVKDRYQFRDVIAHVLTFDYLGALGASLLFPVLLVPRLGLVRSAMLFGLINAAVALWSTYLFANQLSRTRGLRVACLLVLFGLGAGLAAVPAPRRVLILGGGDGLAVREILKYPQVESITLVDLDPEMTRIFSSNPMLTSLNASSLLSPRVHVINADAFPWVDSNADSFDFIVIDFPDPTNYSLGKLYTTAFYRAVSRHLSAQGFIVVQSTSPMFARDSFWCIAQTLKQAGLQTYPYHVYVPSFGEWGFVLAGTHEYAPPKSLPAGLRFVSVDGLPSLFQFPPDMAPLPMPANQLNSQILVRIYENDWKDISP